MTPFLRALALGATLPSVAFFLAGCSQEPGASAAGKAPGPAAANPAPAAPTAPAEIAAVPNEVQIDNFTFRPRRLEVTAGTRVTWVNRDDVPHTATSTARPRAFDSRTLDTDERFEHVFTIPGTYDYFCAVHPHMTGQVIVK
jgi:plastocyanin